LYCFFAFGGKEEGTFGHAREIVRLNIMMAYTGLMLWQVVVLVPHCLAHAVLEDTRTGRAH
jgi:hypothetical protein